MNQRSPRASVKFTYVLERSFGFLCALLCLCAMGAKAMKGSQVSEADEDQIRAAVVIGIVRYTKWEVDSGNFLNICLVGNADSFEYLQGLQKRPVIKKKELNIFKINSVEQGTNAKCQVLVMGPKTAVDVRDIDLNESCLLICDKCTEEKSQASVVLRKEDKRIRFDVYLERARKNRINFSSAMLELAARVEGLNE